MRTRLLERILGYFRLGVNQNVIEKEEEAPRESLTQFLISIPTEPHMTNLCLF